MKKKLISQILAAALVVPLLSIPATVLAETFPSRTIKIMIPFNPGGQSDVAATLLRPGIEEKLGQEMVMEHRPGGGGSVGWTMLTQKKPDGYIMAITNLPHIVVQPLKTKGVKYKTEQLAPVYLYAQSPGGIAVTKDSPFKTLKDLVDFAKANPKKLSIGGTGKFSGNHLGYLQFSQMAGIDSSYVSFNGAAPQTAALLGGHVMATYGGTFVFSNNKDKLRVLAVATEERLADFPDVPTFKESGYELIGGIDRGITVPAGTPQDRIQKLADAIDYASKQQEFIDGMTKLGFHLVHLGPKEYADFIDKRKAQYTKILKDGGFL